MPGTAESVAWPWRVPLTPTVALLLLVLVYLRGWLVLSRRMPGRVSAGRLGAFLAGVVTLGLAWSASLDGLTHFLLTAHMAQHLLFMLVAPPLLLWGSPFLVFARGLARERQQTPGEPFRFPGLAWARRLGHWLTHPVAAGGFMVLITIAWHIPTGFALAMGSSGWHAVEDATFLGSGLLFWWPVMLPWPARQRWPRWTVPLYLLGADLPVSVLSAYLAFCGYVVYPCYLAVPRLFGISALNDQVAAAMLMWVAMLLVFLGAAIAVVVDLLEPAWRLSPEAHRDAWRAGGASTPPTHLF